MTSPKQRPDFSQVYRAYVSRIYRYVFARVGNREDAEDLTAQVFYEALEKWPTYKEEGHLSAWLFTIARRRVVNYYRRRRFSLPLEAHTAVSAPPWDGVEREEELNTLALLVEQLTEEEQELLRLRFAAGLTYREIGDCPHLDEPRHLCNTCSVQVMLPNRQHGGRCSAILHLCRYNPFSSHSGRSACVPGARHSCRCLSS